MLSFDGRESGERGFKTSTQTLSSLSMVIYVLCFPKLPFDHVSLSLVPFDGLRSRSWAGRLVYSFIIKMFIAAETLAAVTPPSRCSSEQHQLWHLAFTTNMIFLKVIFCSTVFSTK